MELQRLFTVVVDEAGNLGLDVHDDNLSEFELIGMLEWAKGEVLAAVNEEDEGDDGNPPMRYPFSLN